MLAALWLLSDCSAAVRCCSAAADVVGSRPRGQAERGPDSSPYQRLLAPKGGYPLKNDDGRRWVFKG